MRCQLRYAPEKKAPQQIRGMGPRYSEEPHQQVSVVGAVTLPAALSLPLSPGSLEGSSTGEFSSPASSPSRVPPFKLRKGNVGPLTPPTAQPGIPGIAICGIHFLIPKPPEGFEPPLSFDDGLQIRCLATRLWRLIRLSITVTFTPFEATVTSIQTFVRRRQRMTVRTQ